MTPRSSHIHQGMRGLLVQPTPINPPVCEDVEPPEALHPEESCNPALPSFAAAPLTLSLSLSPKTWNSCSFVAMLRSPQARGKGDATIRRPAGNLRIWVFDPAAAAMPCGGRPNKNRNQRWISPKSDAPTPRNSRCPQCRWHVESP